jgi:hypothetical protein
LDADSQLRTRELVKDLVLAPVCDDREILNSASDAADFDLAHNSVDEN